MLVALSLLPLGKALYAQACYLPLEKWWEEYGHTLGVKSRYEEKLWSLHLCRAGIVLVWVLTVLCFPS